MVEGGTRTPWHLWLVGVVALLFNAIGVFDFTMVMIQGAAYMAQSGMTPEQIDLYQRFPAWMTAVWAIGVFAAFLASILLLMRRRLAAPVFAISLGAFLVNLAYIYLVAKGGAVMGQAMAITNVVIAVLLLLFGIYARAMAKRGVLR